MNGNLARVPGNLAGVRAVRRWAAAAVAGVLAAFASPAAALDITGYSAAVNDRFTSGFPTNPVPNTSGSFVGSAYDWSGVAWSTATDIPSPGFYKGFAMLSPRHTLVAQHFYNGSDDPRIRGRDGVVSTRPDTAVTNLGYGLPIDGQYDLAMATLSAPITTPANMARYAVLDLFPTSTSTTYSVYNNLSLLAYGRGSTTTGSPRVGAASVFSAQLFSSTNSFTPIIATARSGTPSVQLAVGDSGSPLLHGWTNPDGQPELTVLGLNSSFTQDNLYNIMSLLAAPGAMANASDTMAVTGYALRVQGNVAATWTGAVSSSLWIVQNWSGSPVDQYAEFRADGTTPATITVNNAAFIRGLYFTEEAGATQGFAFSGPQTLTIGRGGLTNYASLRQTFSNAVALADNQYWEAGPGGVTAANINTNGWVLEIAGSGTSRITGAVSGAGGLALSGHRLELTGSNSYTGGTWVHGGTLVVNGTIAASSGVSLDAGAVLGGSGRVSGISGAGSVGPGNSPGILTATNVNPAGGLDFSFEFGKTGAPIWATGTASGNDVLRLTNASSPFTSSLGASNAIDVYLAATTLAFGDTFQGGLFTDASGDFLASIQNATFTYYVLGNGLGTATTYNGQGYYLLDTTFWPAFDEVVLSTVSVASANFADGTVTNGRVMQITVVPEPASIWLAVAAGATAIAARRVSLRRPTCRMP